MTLPEEIDLPEGLQEYTRNFGYVTNPITIIDKKTFGLDSHCIQRILFQKARL